MRFSIRSQILRAFVLAWLAILVLGWAVWAIFKPGYIWIALAVVGFVVAIGAALALSWSITGRLRRVRALVEALIGTHESLVPELGSDEIGDIGRAAYAIAPELRKLADGLNAALVQREAILEGMSEALLVVEHDLKVSFCNSTFLRKVAGVERVEQGASLLRVVRDPRFLTLIKGVLQTWATRYSAAASSISSACRAELFPRFAQRLWSRQMARALKWCCLLDITEIERLERVRKDFVANVSHELRTPLTAIRGYSETLLDGAIDDVENRTRFLETILAQSDRLTNIASDLLTLSDLESGLSSALAPLPVAEIVSSVMQTVQSEASTRSVELICGEIPPDLRARGNRVRLEQVLINLLHNAIKFNRAGGTVRVEVKLGPDGSVRISIADSGIGIPSEDLARIFERFYRVDKARSRSVGGTGLGLSIVKHAMEQMNGLVAVDSTLGKGSCFTISLPVER